MLEADKYVSIMGRGSTWLRYVDDVIVILPNSTNVENKLRRLNGVNKDIQFTIETEKEGELPFLDTVIRRAGKGVKFAVYRKLTNRDDFVHYFSGHSRSVKRGVLIGFFLRAFRICSDIYLEDEINYIKRSFRKLKYPNGLICRMKEKAKEIHNRTNAHKTENEKKSTYITVPNSINTESMDKFLLEGGMKAAKVSSNKIGKIVRRKEKSPNNELSVVYQIPCKGCSASYFGETSRGISKRLSEHKNDLRAHRTSNSLVQHVDKHGHLPNWKEAKILQKGLGKKARKTVESAYINTNENTNGRDGFVCLSKVASVLVLGTTKRMERGTIGPGAVT